MEDKNNKLDNFLRKHLNDASENQKWNVPNDAIFERAMRTVANEKKKNKRGWVLIPLFFLAGLVGSEYLHNRQIKMLEGKITHLEDSLAVVSQNDETTPTTIDDNQDISTSGIVTPVTTQEDINSSASAQNTSSYANSSSPSTIDPTSKINTSKATTSTKALASNDKKALPTSANSASKKSGNTPATQQLPTSAANTKAESIALPAVAENINGNESKQSISSNQYVSKSITTEEDQLTDLSAIPFAGNWITTPLSPITRNGVVGGESFPSDIYLISANSTNSIQLKSIPVPAMRYGLLAGVNQSWLTMTNIPPTGDAYLYNYDNSQPGFNMYGFVQKPLSSKFSAQVGLGYGVYNNKSVLEDQFLFDPDNVTQMPDGPMYQTDMNLINPLGGYDMLLEFRVADDMMENDVMVEYTTIEQTLQFATLDLGVQYNLLSVRNFSVSLGTGFGLAYRTGLTNEFNISTYHNNILQRVQTEAPDELRDVRSWYVQWLGNLSVEYRPTNRLGFMLGTQYNRGLSSIRNGHNGAGPLTFLHAFSLSAGVTNSF